MKVIDSGMPDEAYWSRLFDVPGIVHWLRLERVTGPIVEIGCGYGTFTVPVAQKATATVYALDIEPTMIQRARENALKANLRNVEFILRDVVEHGTGLKRSSIGMVLLFNILHFEGRRHLLDEAARILKPGGVAAIIHWRKDIETPRGPQIATRPDLEMILSSLKDLDLHYHGEAGILEPYHWGIQLEK